MESKGFVHHQSFTRLWPWFQSFFTELGFVFRSGWCGSTQSLLCANMTTGLAKDSLAEVTPFKLFEHAIELFKPIMDEGSLVVTLPRETQAFGPLLCKRRTCHGRRSL